MSAPVWATRDLPPADSPAGAISAEVQHVADGLASFGVELERDGQLSTLDSDKLVEHVQRLRRAAALLRAEGR